MNKFVGFGLTFLFILSITMLSVSCAKKTVQSDQSMQSEQEATETGPGDTEETDQQAMEEQRLEEERLAAEQKKLQAEQEAMAAKDEFANEDIHFDFDSAVIIGSAQNILQGKAQYLTNNPNVMAVIEGHCDERGTEAYNLSLGERRAEAVKNFLINLGVDSGRLNTISYGEERPVDAARTEAAWAKNRRAHLYVDSE
jgi:peptidoglycan-associated lipoprotein